MLVLTSRLELWFPPFRKVRERMGHPFRADIREKQILRYAQDDKSERDDNYTEGAVSTEDVSATHVFVEPVDGALPGQIGCGFVVSFRGCVAIEAMPGAWVDITFVGHVRCG